MAKTVSRSYSLYHSCLKPIYAIFPSIPSAAPAPVKALTGASRKGFWPAKILRILCHSHVPKNKTRAVGRSEKPGPAPGSPGGCPPTGNDFRTPGAMMDIFHAMMDVFFAMMVIFSSMSDKFLPMLNINFKMLNQSLKMLDSLLRCWTIFCRCRTIRRKCWTFRRSGRNRC